MLFVPDDVRERLKKDCLADDSPHIRAILRAAGLRPTRQRLGLGDLIFREGHRHVTAECLHRETKEKSLRLSLATVYNTLNQFAEAGLLRRIAIGGGRATFDTDTGDHQHFFIASEGRVLDMPRGAAVVGAPPPPPPGYEIAGIDLVIRLGAEPQQYGSAPSRPRRGELGGIPATSS